MALNIEQAPLTGMGSVYRPTPVGQQLIFTVSNPPAVANKFNVKFRADVFISKSSIDLTTTTDRVGIFKTTPNNAGVGMFDFRPVLETFLKSDNEGSTYQNGSRYKTNDVTHPIHLIDKYAMSDNSIRFMAINFYTELSNTVGGTIRTTDPEASDLYIIFNGVIQHTDVLSLVKGNYGYDMNRPSNFFYTTLDGQFLSNAPTTQYATVDDYGTLPFFNFLPINLDKLTKIRITYYFDGGSSTEDVNQNWTNGGLTNLTSRADKYLMYFGGFPANLKNWSSTFDTAVSNGLTHYTIQGMTTKGGVSYLSQLYTMQIICPNGSGYNKGYEMIRLAWLNQWGAWDYYTFTMKSIKSVSSRRIPYQQQAGTWNESRFKISGYKGGKKNFRVNTTEKIRINTDFVTEAEGVWLEELVNSPEVYIINKYQADISSEKITNKYVEPVILTTSDYVRKTIANDKLMQYTFEIEKSKMQRTQAV
jgi:hypothetical protein|tara:strand:- start:3979 stop:5403 length:1425 start_codon:yes stop_codon:yes gene_type:complete